jgi:hypothetical protein
MTFLETCYIAAARTPLKTLSSIVYLVVAQQRSRRRQHRKHSPPLSAVLRHLEANCNTAQSEHSFHCYVFVGTCLSSHWLEMLWASMLQYHYWFRYVDDTFVIWPHGPDNLKDFLKHLNFIHQSIQFTIETETEGDLPFLDVGTSHILTRGFAGLTEYSLLVNKSSQSQSHVATDGQSVCQSWCRAPAGAHDQMFSSYMKVALLSIWGAISDERSGLSFLSLSQSIVST